MDNSAATHGERVRAADQALREALLEVRASELDRGVCLAGPHRDELELSVRGLPARGYASHGESWSMALALRLASFDLLRAGREDPVLILDDVFAELDAGRRDRLAALVAAAEQVLVTAAVPEDIPSLLAGVHFKLSAGTLTEASGEERQSPAVATAPAEEPATHPATSTPATGTARRTGDPAEPFPGDAPPRPAGAETGTESAIHSARQAIAESQPQGTDARPVAAWRETAARPDGGGALPASPVPPAGDQPHAPPRQARSGAQAVAAPDPPQSGSPTTGSAPIAAAEREPGATGNPADLPAQPEATDAP